jgi:nicotinamidase-related amidase
MKALLIIDMQQESFPHDGSNFDAAGVIARINMLSAKFRAAGRPVIVVQHDGSLQKEYVPGTPGFEILPAVSISPKDLRVIKTVNDSFYETTLQKMLARLAVTELVITGSATDFCIDSTVQSALVKDYTVYVVKDGHTAGDRPHLRGQQIVEHYNWVWANLTPTKGNVLVKAAAEIE